MGDISEFGADIKGIRDAKKGRGIVIGLVGECKGKIKEYFV